jgi:electron transport complex, RnfABCDGE type, G subunit
MEADVVDVALPDARPLPAQPQSWRLLLTLTVAGAAAGLLIVLFFNWTKPRIDAYKSRQIKAAIEEVLHAPQRTDTLYLERGTLLDKPSAASEPGKVERIYKGFSADGHVIGYAFGASEAGFQDQIVLLVGYDSREKQLLGIKILDSKETPGLGDKIQQPSFFAQFARRLTPLLGVKGAAPANDKHAIAMITGATISSRAVIREINNGLKKWQPVIDRYEAGAK